MAKQPIRAMGFFQSGDLAKAAAQALRFAGDGGRLGTMLDIVDARLATTLGSNAWERYWNSLVVELGCHERWNGVRALGIRGQEPITSDVHPGIAELSGHLGRNWRRLMQPVRGKRPQPDFVNLTRCGEHWFSQYPMGDGVMMTGEPEFRVVKKTRVSGPGTFRTEILGYYGLFKYEEKDVRTLAPKGANAYHFGEPTIESHDGNPTHHVAPVQWFCVTLDTSERLPKSEDLLSDVELQLRLLDAA